MPQFCWFLGARPPEPEVDHLACEAVVGPLFDELAMEVKSQKAGVPPHAASQVRDRNLDLTYTEDRRSQASDLIWTRGTGCGHAGSVAQRSQTCGSSLVVSARSLR